MKNIISMEKLLEKVKKIKESGSFDLSMEEDLSIAIMNLVSLEEHFYFTAEKTGKNDEAEKTWKEAYRIYALFWGLRLKLINISDIKKSVPKLQEEKPKTKEEVINKLLDCCDE